MSPGLMATTGITPHIAPPHPANIAPTPLPSAVLFSRLQKRGFWGVPGLRLLLSPTAEGTFAGATCPAFPNPTTRQTLFFFFFFSRVKYVRIYLLARPGWGETLPYGFLEEFLPKSVSNLCNTCSCALGGDIPRRAGISWGLKSCCFLSSLVILTQPGLKEAIN